MTVEASPTLHDAQLYLAGRWVEGARTDTLTDKYDGTPVATVHVPSRAQVDDALAALAAAQARISWTPYERYQVLARASELLAARRDEAARTVVLDTGFTLADAGREVERGVQTLLLSAEEAKRLTGEMVPVASAPGGGTRIAFTTLHPIGVVCAITPFNSPLNTVLHKVAPALAAGNGVLLKPASLTPLTAGMIVRLLLEAGTPSELIALVYGEGRDVGQWLLESRVPGFYAFTGSTPVGERITNTIGVRRSQLELGSLSSTIVCDDANVDRCIPLCVNAAFRKAGQVCTSVQRLYVQDGIVDDFVERLADALLYKKIGDPMAPDTFVGPLISQSETERVESWVEAACDAGARTIAGGGRSDRVLEPTVLTNVTGDMQVMREEIFGPVLVVRPFSDLDQAIRETNDTPYGLAGGIFTESIDRALTAARALRMGSVHINETSSSRLDLMPYSGVKQSGIGREGPHWAVREMSEERLVTLGPSA